MHKDILGRPIELGDTIIYPLSTFSDGSLKKGTVAEIHLDYILVSQLVLGISKKFSVPIKSLCVVNDQISKNYNKYPEYYL